jgi:general secretion pathway protein G
MVFLTMGIEAFLLKERAMILQRNQQNRLVRPGFTLMEMMVVVAIIVALAGIGIFFLAPQADEGAKTKAKTDVKSLTAAALVFKTQHGGQWPLSLEALLEKDGNGYGPYVKSREDLIDPWNNEYQYDVNGPNNKGNQPDISCMSPWGLICNWTSQIIPR